MALIGTSRKFHWRRFRPVAWPRTRMARAAAGEAHLIVTSGELALRHAADLAHRPADGWSGGRVDLYPVRRRASLHREVIAYAASSIVTALVLAAILFFVVPEALRG